MSREKICAVALGEVGVTEKGSRERIEQYLDSVTDDRWKVDLFENGKPRRLRFGDAWCACFASWVYREAGHPIEHDHGVGCYGCHRLIDECKKHSAWYDRSYEGQPGDLIFFDWQLDPDAFEGHEISEEEARKIVDHVGVIIDVEKDTDGNVLAYITVEGNWGRAVKKLRRAVDSKAVLGFGALVG